MNPYKKMAITTSVIILVFSAYAFIGHGPATYRFAFAFLLPLLWGAYALRLRCAMSLPAFLMLCAAFVLHDLGTFGMYKRYFFNLHFDSYVHFFFGIAGGLILARAFQFRFRLYGWRLWIGVVVFILGIGAIHELIECASTVILGPQKGMLKLDDPNPFDTQKDLMNNGLGSLVALAFYTFVNRKSPPGGAIRPRLQ